MVITEVTNELLLEVLKKVQEQVARGSEDMSRIREELSAMRGHIVALQQDIHNIYDTMLEHGTRLDRIERLLELVGSQV